MKIRTKITITYLLIAVLIIASFGVLASVWMETYFKDRLVNELSRKADLVLYILKEDSTRSLKEIDQRIKTIGKLENLRITLIDENGIVLSDSDILLEEISKLQNHSDRPEVIQAKQEGVGHSIRLSASVGREFLYMAKDVKNILSNSIFKNLRILRLSVPYRDVKQQIDYIHTIEIIAGLIVLAVVIVVSIFISRRLSSPMIQIAHDIEKIRNGDLNAKVVIKSNDEFGLVANAVNELVEKLKADIIQLKKLEQVRSQFLGNVSHELRTPLFSIQGYIETLLGGAIEDASVNRNFLYKAQTNLDRLNTLLEELINISQIESGELKLSFRYFQLNEFLESVCKEFEKKAADRNVTLKLALATGKNDEVLADKDRLRQVMNNLISNALSYNKNGGEVIISSKKNIEGIEIEVKDTGVGIPEEHLTRIFERFYRVDSDRSRSLGGTGLGLAIVKHIIEAHDSHVIVKSKINEGTSFSFKLKSV